MVKKIYFLYLVMLPVFFLFTYIPADAATMVWDPSSGVVTGYKIYYRTSLDSEHTLGDTIGNVTQYPLSNLQLEEGATYYFVVKAYNSAGESEPSNEVPYTKTTQAGGAADTLNPTVTITSPTSDGLYKTGFSTISLEGVASDNIGVTQVTWSGPNGAEGKANGTDNWSIVGIQLSIGKNVITVTASDSAGNTGTSNVTIDHIDTTSPQAPQEIMIQ